MSRNNHFDYASFVDANAGKKVSRIDYLHMMLQLKELPDDFVVSLSRLFSPDFIVLDGVVFVSDLFDSARYDELRGAGHSQTSVQYWMNLLEITGLFENLPSDEAFSIATSVARSWNAKLQEEFTVPVASAKAVYDGETGDVYVTLVAVG